MPQDAETLFLVAPDGLDLGDLEAALAAPGRAVRRAARLPEGPLPDQILYLPLEAALAHALARGRDTFAAGQAWRAMAEALAARLDGAAAALAAADPGDSAPPPLHALVIGATAAAPDLAAVAAALARRAGGAPPPAEIELAEARAARATLEARLAGLEAERALADEAVRILAETARLAARDPSQ